MQPVALPDGMYSVTSRLTAEVLRGDIVYRCQVDDALAPYLAARGDRLQLLLCGLSPKLHLPRLLFNEGEDIQIGAKFSLRDHPTVPVLPGRLDVDSDAVDFE